MKLIVLNLIMALCLVSCGIKGDPMPPSETETVQKNPESMVKKEEPAATADLTKPPASAPTPKKKKKTE